ncbi:MULTISPECIES: VMAP-C domain-containing protein [unclassified Streptomyces]|uniref:VMAP-C domain-containing protein n=1 Tax=unclassified Streptomyces TaxID=2593676 RepID=UPI002E1ADD81
MESAAVSTSVAGGQRPYHSGWSAEHVDELCHALLGFYDMQHNPEFFKQVLDSMGTELGEGNSPFVVPYHAHARSQVAALVHVMDRHHDPGRVLRALSKVLHFLRSEEAATVRLARIVDELAPAGRLTGSRLRAVVAQLDALKDPVPLPFADEALRRALLPGEPSGLRGNETVTGMVKRLNDARDFTTVTAQAAPHAPLVLRFLSELTGALSETEQLLLRSQISLAVSELGLPASVEAELSGRGRRLVPPDERRVLQIRLRETVPGKQKYTVDAALFDLTATGLCRPRKRETQRPLSTSELKEFGRTCLTEWSDLVMSLDEADWVRVEFLLPWSLLGHPVEHWLTDGHEYLLGHKYPVVVRSLDRLERPSWRRDWTRRWRALQHAAMWPSCDGIAWLALDTPPQSGLDGEVLHVRGRDGEVRAWLDERPQTTALGLGLAFAYDPQSPKRALCLQEAVCEGVPLIVWRRDGGDPVELARRASEIVAAKFSELPDHMRRWRRTAARDNTGDMHNHLTLLWDDPECVRQETVLTAPTHPQKS